MCDTTFSDDPKTGHSNCFVPRKVAIQTIIGEEARASSIDTWDLPVLLNYTIRSRVKDMLVDAIEALPSGEDKTIPTDIDDVIFMTSDFVITVVVQAQQKLRSM